MHADDSISSPAQQLNGIIARDNRIRWILLHAEVIAVRDCVDNLDEAVHLLRKFRIFPKPVLIVILHAEHNAVLPRDGKHLLNCFEHPVSALLPSDLRIALAAEDATDGSGTAQTACDANHLCLAIDFAFSLL